MGIVLRALQEVRTFRLRFTANGYNGGYYMINMNMLKNLRKGFIILTRCGNYDITYIQRTNRIARQIPRFVHSRWRSSVNFSFVAYYYVTFTNACEILLINSMKSCTSDIDRAYMPSSYELMTNYYGCPA